MPRPTQNKLYKTFTKGLITEAGPLTYPEDASTDELNTVIKIKGSRSRRLGLDFEPSSALGTIGALSDPDPITEFAWKGVNNDSSVNFLVVQVDGSLYFYNMDGVPIIGTPNSITITLSFYKAAFATDAQVNSTPTQMASGKGFLFVVSPYIDPIVVEYLPASNSFSVLPVIIQVRDFDGIDDLLGNEDQPTSLTKEHFYNLRNQGWVLPGPLGVLQGAGTTNPYTPPSPPTTTTPEYIDPYSGTVRPYIP